MRESGGVERKAGGSHTNAELVDSLESSTAEAFRRAHTLGDD